MGDMPHHEVGFETRRHNGDDEEIGLSVDQRQMFPKGSKMQSNGTWARPARAWARQMLLKADTGKTYLLVAHNGIARVVQSYFYDMTNEE